MSQEPFLGVFKPGLIHSYYKIMYIDCSVLKWTMTRGINELFKILINQLIN